MMQILKIITTISLAFCIYGCSNQEVKEEQKKSVEFQYVPKKPVDGKYSGIVELGGDGFNSFIINADSSNLWFMEKAEFGISNAYDDNAEIAEIQSGLEAYINKMLDYNVNGNDIHFVVSSTAAKNKRVQLIDSILASIGYVVNTVNDNEEGKFALIATLPERFYENGFVVDIGSGNTKISWVEGDSIYSRSTYGAKYYTNNTEDRQVSQEVEKILSQIPAARKKHCFIIGGIPFKMAKDYRKDDERYTVLKSPDTYIVGDDKKFNGGLNIYRTIYEDTNTDLVIFDWEANFSIGFLLSVKDRAEASDEE
ncbi:MAG: hypothetical protein WBA74_15845 [Cyclobacteriaceae bacterium]